MTGTSEQRLQEELQEEPQEEPQEELQEELQGRPPEADLGFVIEASAPACHEVLQLGEAAASRLVDALDPRRARPPGDP